MTPPWLTVLAWIYIGLCLGCAGVITWDIVVAGHRQPMGVMNFVFPITALYFGPLAVAFYWRWARVPARSAAMSVTEPVMAGSGGHMPDMSGAVPRKRRPGWVAMAIE